ncbi:MAG TPA: hypothetical protein ENK55_10200 [Actinobacteria bacterium]|nr:hypothetical protein [Actinomycetota bacterium]
MNDEQLLRDLAEALDEPPPPWVVSAGKEAWTWRSIDAELAELRFDSATAGATGARQGTVIRELTFAAGDLEVELAEVEAGVYVGQVIGGAPVEEVRLQGPEGEAAVGVDAAGRFRIEVEGLGPRRLVVAAGSSTVVTDWFLP